MLHTIGSLSEELDHHSTLLAGASSRTNSPHLHANHRKHEIDLTVGKCSDDNNDVDLNKTSMYRKEWRKSVHAHLARGAVSFTVVRQKIPRVQLYSRVEDLFVLEVFTLIPQRSCACRAASR